MKKLFRIFALWWLFFFMMLILVLGFELVNSSVSTSGFSSGEVFVFERTSNEIKGEFFGRSFVFDPSVLGNNLRMAEKLVFLLPPCSQLFLRAMVFVFLRI